MPPMAKLARGELEARIMELVWNEPDAVTPREVHDLLVRRNQALAYTTVTTILVRLWKKGMLQREPMGRAFAYRPTASREVWTAQRMREILRQSSDSQAALAHFAQSIDRREVTQLRRALDRRPRS
jgi:BlaI family transcriptional regulator, penicillinase repressor